MTSPAVPPLLPGLAALLADEGLGDYSPTDPYPLDHAGPVITLGGMPARPDRAVVLTEYTGTESNSNEPYDLVFVQVRVRGTVDESVSRGHARAVYDLLNGVGRRTLPNGSRVVNIVAQGLPGGIGVDANNRHEHVVNVRVEEFHPTALRPA